MDRQAHTDRQREATNSGHTPASASPNHTEQRMMATAEMQFEKDRDALRQIERRGELQSSLKLDAESERSNATLDADDFRRIHDRNLRVHAAVQIADNASESEPYKQVHEMAGIAGEFEALNAENAAKEAAKEERKAQDFANMRADQMLRANNWTDQEARRQAARDLETYRLETNQLERAFMRGDMAVNAGANREYRSSLDRASPDLAREVQRGSLEAKLALSGTRDVSHDTKEPEAPTRSQRFDVDVHERVAGVRTRESREDANQMASNRAAARAFENQTLEAAVHGHPELAGAAAFVSAVERKVEADRLTEQQRLLVMSRVRENVTHSIERGDIPQMRLREALSVRQKEEVEKDHVR